MLMVRNLRLKRGEMRLCQGAARNRAKIPVLLRAAIIPESRSHERFVYPMTSSPDSLGEGIGIIAGNRSLPLVFAREARRMGIKKIVAVAFDKETDPKLAELVDEIVWIKVGQLGKLISAFTERGVRRCVMLGQI